MISDSSLENHILFCSGMFHIYMPPLFLKLSSISKLLIVTAKWLVSIKTQSFYSCLILTKNFLVNIKTRNFYSCLILTETFLGNIRDSILSLVNIKTQIVYLMFSSQLQTFKLISELNFKILFHKQSFGFDFLFKFPPYILGLGST